MGVTVAIDYCLVQTDRPPAPLGEGVNHTRAEEAAPLATCQTRRVQARQLRFLRDAT